MTYHKTIQRKKLNHVGYAILDLLATAVNCLNKQLMKSGKTLQIFRKFAVAAYENATNEERFFFS